MNELFAAAQDYIGRGLQVIALTGKMPNGRVHPRGIYDALNAASPDMSVWNAFNHQSTTGVGILTGGPLFVVDIDGEDGAAQWQGIAGADFMPDSWVAKTGRGLHLYYGTWTPRATRKLGPKLDLKGEGGYVAAPPSRHPDGHLYTWLLAPGSQLDEAPRGLVALLDEQDALRAQAAINRSDHKRVRHAPLEDGKFWATPGFGGLIIAVKQAEPGNRNACLYWAARTMTEDGGTEEDFMELSEAAIESGLTGRETRLTIRSAQKAAAGG